MTMAEFEKPGTGVPGSLPAIPVRAEGQDLSGGHQGVHLTYQIAAGENPVVQLLPRDYDRLEARILACAPSPTPNGGASLSATGTQTDPGAGATIISLALPAGTWSVTVTEMLPGGGAAADTSNMQLLQGATVIGTPLLDPFVTGTQQAPAVTVVIPPGGAVLTVKTIGAASGAGIIYAAQIAATPAAGSLAPSGIVLAQSKEIAEITAVQGAAFAGPPGSFLPLDTDRALRNCDEVWAAALSSVPVLVSAIVSRRLAIAHPAI
jgi:hypothetical protein